MTSISTGDQVDLCLHDWSTGDPKAAVALFHGYGEHAARYAHVAHAFNARGISVVAADLRGHGRSEGTRGHVERFSDLANYLLFPQDHRVQTGRNLEEVVNAFIVPVDVKKPVDVEEGDVELVDQKLLDAIFAKTPPLGRPRPVHRLHGVELGTVASTQDHPWYSITRHGLQRLGPLGLG